jgi:hypothetical protein
MSKKPFVKMKVYFDESGYQQAVKNAEDKIKVVSVALEWCEKHIIVEAIDRKKFLADMVEEFNRQVVLQKGDIVKQEIAVEKLHFLLDVHITELKAIQSQYERLEANIYVDNDDFVSGVSEEDFTRYTQNEEENEKVIRANNFINAIEMVSKYRQTYPVDLCRGTSNFIKYDYRRNKYFPSL